MICALLSWFDENPAALDACIRSLGLAGVGAVVAVDGPYRMFGGESRSAPEERAAIFGAARDIGADCVIYERASAWPSEVDKRTFMFRAGEALTTPDDWYLVIDADEVLFQIPEDLAERLGATDCDAATIGVLDKWFKGNVAWVGGDGQLPTIALGRQVKPLRCFFRAIRGLSVGGRHWDYLTPDGRNLWGGEDDAVPALLLDDVLMDHRDAQRSPDRKEARQRYYRARDEAGIERKLPPLSAA